VVLIGLVWDAAAVTTPRTQPCLIDPPRRCTPCVPAGRIATDLRSNPRGARRPNTGSRTAAQKWAEMAMTVDGPILHPRRLRDDPPTPSELLPVAGAAGRLGVPVRFIRRLIAERRIRFYKIGRYVRIDSRDLDAFIAAGRIDPPAGRQQ